MSRFSESIERIHRIDTLERLLLKARHQLYDAAVQAGNKKVPFFLDTVGDFAQSPRQLINAIDAELGI